MHTVTGELGGRPISIESGKLARQAGGSAVVRYGDTMVLVTATADKRESPKRGFVPLSVHYVEKMYAAGRIPGSFFRREGRLTDHETLISRFIDRPIRPLFPDTWLYETQVIATVLSTDHDNEPAVAAMLGASAALAVSDIPFPSAIAGVRVGMLDGEYVLNPTRAQLEQSALNLFIVGTQDAILMVEGSAKEVSEADALDAIMFGHKSIQPLLEMQAELKQKEGKPKRPVKEVERNKELEKAVEKACHAELAKALQVPDKQERYAALDRVQDDVIAQFYKEGSDQPPLKAEV